MTDISVKYTTKYRLSFAHNYEWTKCGKCFNVKTGRQIKKVYNNGCIGYTINSRFRSLKYLRNYIEKISKIDCPF